MVIIKSQDDTLENQFVPHHIDVWYDRHSRNWVVQLKDVYDNQVGKALYSYGKQEAIKNKSGLQEQYNLK